MYCDVMFTLYMDKDIQQVLGSIPTRTKLRNNLGQVVHTYVPLSSHLPSHLNYILASPWISDCPHNRRWPAEQMMRNDIYKQISILLNQGAHIANRIFVGNAQRVL